jgi:hypothetical protein
MDIGRHPQPEVCGCRDGADRQPVVGGEDASGSNGGRHESNLRAALVAAFVAIRSSSTYAPGSAEAFAHEVAVLPHALVKITHAAGANAGDALVTQLGEMIQRQAGAHTIVHTDERRVADQPAAAARDRDEALGRPHSGQKVLVFGRLLQIAAQKQAVAVA